MDFKEKLKFARLETGLSRSLISKKTGLPLGSLENWEWGRTSPPAYVEDLIIEKILQLKRSCTVVFGPYSTVTLTLDDKNEIRKYNLNMSADGQRLERDLYMLIQDHYKITYKYDK